jgi:two-component system response regulator AtoC
MPESPIIIGQGEAVREIRRKIKRLSDKDVTVLINGESGTGKELIARSIHHYSQRNGGPLVKVNCATLPDELLESEIFGFQKGAFTDAHQDKPGLLEMANGGTLFIDEIGELSLPLQVKFLQVLEDKAFSRLGATRDKIIDARVVAATNSNLWKKVREGTFRSDLFYRLNVVHIEAPPLRQLREDIPLLTDYFLNKYCFEFKRGLLDVPDKVANFFQAYHWPGNVRELENVVRRAIALRDWNFVFEELKLESEDYESEHLAFSGASPRLLVWHDDKVRRFFKDSDFCLKKISKAYLSEVERQEIMKALQVTHWNRKNADLLQISYKTLLNRILEFDLKP